MQREAHTICCRHEHAHFTGFLQVMDFLEYHEILEGLLQTLKVRELYIFSQNHGESRIFVCILKFTSHLSEFSTTFMCFVYC